MRFVSLLAAALLAAVVAPLPTPPAEREGYEATPSLAETLEVIGRYASATPTIRLTSFGRSAEGRELPLVIVGAPGLDDPRAAHRSGKPILLVQSGIHAGEIDGKDATLAILHDIARDLHPEIVERLVVLFVPVYNVDGHERVSPWNRPNQNGPVRGMGFRTTADGHDLNRDHLKLDTPEARALIGLFNRWRPHLHVDNHVTNGVDHGWVVTWTWSEPPAIAAPLGLWLARTMPGVAAETEAAGHPNGPYVELLDDLDPTRGFNSWVGEPRYATGYFPLRNRPSILVENHAHKPYGDRVRANREFLLALFRAVARDPQALVEAVEASEAATVEAGRRADERAAVVAWEAAPPDERRLLPLHDWQVDLSTVLGAPFLNFDPVALRPIEVPWAHRPEARLVVTRPRGYLVMPGWPEIESRLRGHGLRVARLTAAAELEVETFRLSAVKPASPGRATYQGRTQIDFTVDRVVERRAFPAGTLWIGADQPDFEVAIQLFEPEAPDSLARWGILSLALERKEYIGTPVLERLARRLLDEPAVRAEWERALEDPAFAADRGARWLWWYRRTRHWDETVGLLPVMRLLAEPVVATEPWSDATF